MSSYLTTAAASNSTTGYFPRSESTALATRVTTAETSITTIDTRLFNSDFRRWASIDLGNIGSSSTSGWTAINFLSGTPGFVTNAYR
jgi:hypothetical protein